MSLKVLLADDSAAIKKVVQLSLQDFGVELRSVGSGKDVLDVARHYVPDIAFIDVLLPHLTGYEVAAQMKKDATLKKTPIVMLWSAFMAFDEAKFKASGADEKLEKPFEVSALRELVTLLVPKNQANPLSMHLDFPKMEFDGPIGSVPPPKKTMPEMPSAPPAPPAAQAAPPVPPRPVMPTSSPVKPPAPPQAQPRPTQGQPVRGNPSPAKSPGKEEWSMGSFDDIASFSANIGQPQDHDEIEIDGATPMPPGAAPAAAPVPGSDNPQLETDFFNFGGTVNKTLTNFFGSKAQSSAAVVSRTPASAQGQANANAASSTPSADAGNWNSDNNEWVRKDLGKFKVSIPDEEDDTVAFQYNENEIKNTNFLLQPEPNAPATAQGASEMVQAAAPQQEGKTDVFIDSGSEATKTAQMVTPSDITETALRTGKGPAASSEPPANVTANSVPRPGHAQQQMQSAPARYEISEKDVEKIKEEVRNEMREIIERVVWKLVPEIASQIIRAEIARLTNEQ